MHFLGLVGVGQHSLSQVMGMRAAARTIGGVGH